jgi:hypothetical protein
MSLISFLFLINLIFDIRCSCKYRIENTVDSESSDENFIPTQESSDEQEEQDEQEEEEQEEKPKESFKVDCVENCSKSCLCKTEQQTNDDMTSSDSINKTEQETDDMPPSDSINKTEQEDDDMPPLVPMNEIEPVPEHTLRDQIIN